MAEELELDDLEPTDPPETEAVDPPEPPKTPLLDYWEQEYGVRPDGFDSDRDLLDEIARVHHSREEVEQRAAQVAELEKLRPAVTQYQTEREQYEAWKAQQKQQAEAPRQFERPQLSETAELLLGNGVIKLDPQTGLYKSDDPHLASYVAEANRVHEHERKIGRELVRDAFGTVRKQGLDDFLAEREKALEERYAKMLDEKLATMGAQYQLQSIPSDGLYQTDEAGNVLTGSDGQPRLTPRGQVFHKAQAQAEKLLGVEYDKATPKQQLEIRRFAAELAAEVSPAAKADEAEPEPTPAEKRKAKQQTVVNAARKNGHPVAGREPAATVAVALNAAAEHETRFDDLYDQVAQR